MKKFFQILKILLIIITTRPNQVENEIKKIKDRH